MASQRVNELVKQSGGYKYTVGEIAEASGYTEFTIRRHIAEGILPSVRVAGRRLILQEDALKYLKGVRHDPNK